MRCPICNAPSVITEAAYTPLENTRRYVCNANHEFLTTERCVRQGASVSISEWRKHAKDADLYHTLIGGVNV